jgi:uncharacterized cupredoxin-like copper-binding protein
MQPGIVVRRGVDRDDPSTYEPVRRVMRRTTKVMLCGTVAGLALAAPALSAPKATTVTVTAGKPSELRFTLSKKSVAAGAVTFKVTNKGGTTHDFKIAGKTTKKLAPGKSATLKVTLKKGKAAFLCTLPGHAAAGMKGTLTVK